MRSTAVDHRATDETSLRGATGLDAGVGMGVGDPDPDAIGPEAKP